MIPPLAPIEIPRNIAGLPKADIHVHSESGPRLEQVIAERTGAKVTDWVEQARKLMCTLPPGMARLEQWGGRDIPFARSTLDELDRSSGNFKARVGRILVEAATDGAILVEVLFVSTVILREDFLDLFWEALTEVQIEFPEFHAVPVIAATNSEEWALTFLPRCIAGARRGLAGLNILPVPYDQPADWSVVYGWSERARDAGLGITAHAGEFGTLHLAGAMEVPGLTRLGHAVGAGSDPRLLDRIEQRGITVECPLSSNVVVGAVASYGAHPIRRFVERGVKVAICTDDPVRACTTIGREYAVAAELGLSTADLLACTRASIEASFCDWTAREQLLRTLSAPSQQGQAGEVPS